MNYACFNQWDGLKLFEFIEKLQSNTFEKVIMCGQNEWQWNTLGPGGEGLSLFKDYCRSKNIPLEVITGASKEFYYYTDDYANVYWWDTYWIGKTYQDLIMNRIGHSELPRGIDPYKKQAYEYHFISMNGKPHRHRCLFIDLMVKSDLMKHGAVTVHGQDLNRYKWRYFNYAPMKLSDGSNFDQYKLPEQYYQSFFQVISESSSDVIMISEKTATPLILGKPFIVAGQRHFHKTLKRMGFALYNEIFDYSFDDEPNEEVRYEMIMRNINRICQIPLKNLSALQNQIASKVAYNRKLAKEISYDLNLYPKPALDIINYYEETGIELDHRMISVHDNLKRFKDIQF